MRFLLLVRADARSEAGVVPDDKLLAAVRKYNDDLVRAGVLLAAEGLHPSSRGARVRVAGARRTVVDGPFPDPRELIAGFWMIQVKSREEAIEWGKRCPPLISGDDSEIEVRQVFEAPDLPP